MILNSVLHSGESKSCNLHSVLCMPRLSYNLFSVSVTTEHRKTVRFSKDNCQVLDEEKLVAVATKIGELYYLNFHVSRICSNAAETKITELKVDRWHCRFGHLAARSLQILAKDKLVNSFDYDSSGEISFCQACVEGKLHKNQFLSTGGRRAK